MQVKVLLDPTSYSESTAGLGGGTGTGAAPIVTSLAAELGALTVAAVTLPFTFEGRVRARRAQQGLGRLHKAADSVITIPNDRLLGTIDRALPITQAFEVVDDVLVQAIRGNRRSGSRAGTDQTSISPT